MNILIIDEDIYRVGGVERIISILANNLSPKYNVNILSLYKSKENPFFSYKDNIKITSLFDIHKKNSLKFSSKNLMYYYNRLFEKFKNKFLMKKRIVENWDLIIDADVIIFGRVFVANQFFDLFKDKLINKKIIVRDAIHLKYFDDKVKRKLKLYFPKYVHTFIVSSDESILNYKKFFNDKRINIVKIYNPLGIIPKKCGNMSYKNIVSIGRMDSQKGYDALIDIFNYVHKKHPDWKLSIYGDGTYKEKIIKKINYYELNDFVNIYSSTKDVVETLDKASIFAFTSRYEGYANILVEAMSCGLPCISYDFYMGVEEIITHNFNNGIVIKLKNRDNYYNGINDLIDIKKYAEALNNLIDNPTLAQTLMTNALEIVESRKVENIIEKWINIIGK